MSSSFFSNIFLSLIKAHVLEVVNIALASAIKNPKLAPYEPIISEFVKELEAALLGQAVPAPVAP